MAARKKSLAAKHAPKKRPRRDALTDNGGLSRCTPELTARICAYLQIAVPFAHACAAEGINKVTGHRWMNAGEEGKAPYAHFFAEVEKAKSLAVIHLTKRALIGEKGATAAQWLLSRRYRDDYGDVTKVEHAGHDGGPLALGAKFDALSLDELRRLAQPE